MTLLIERIRALRPYLTNVQAELICKDLSAHASDEEIVKAILPHDAVKLNAGTVVADYLQRHDLDDKVTLKEFWDLTFEVERLHHEGFSVEEMRGIVDGRIKNR